MPTIMNIGMKIGANMVYLADIDPTNMLKHIVIRMNATSSSEVGSAAWPSAWPPVIASILSSPEYLKCSTNCPAKNAITMIDAMPAIESVSSLATSRSLRIFFCTTPYTMPGMMKMMNTSGTIALTQRGKMLTEGTSSRPSCSTLSFGGDCPSANSTTSAATICPGFVGDSIW